jgi:SEC-C motif
MTQKLGRNDPCWCGSGKKYKKCHIDRKDQEAVRSWEVDAHFRKRRDKGECLHIGATAGSICGQPAIGSHIRGTAPGQSSPVAIRTGI